MSLQALLSSFLPFCKRRNHSQSSNLPKKIDNGPSNNEPEALSEEDENMSLSQQPSQELEKTLKNSQKTELISEGDDERESLSEQSTNLNDDQSRKTTITIKTKTETVDTSKSREKRIQGLNDSLNSPAEQAKKESNFIKNEGLQPMVGRRTGPKVTYQSESKNSSEQRVQGRIFVGVTITQESIQSGYSSELSYQSKTTADFQSSEEWNKISQVESLLNYDGKYILEEEMRKKALEDLKKFNFAEIGVTKDGRMNGNFSKSRTEKYKQLCQCAKVDPIEYYRLNGQGVSKDKIKERYLKLLSEDGHDISNLRFTVKDLPHKTYTHSKIINWLEKYGYL